MWRKSLTGRFPEKNDIMDKLICLVVLYGDSTKMANDQKLLKTKLMLHPPYSGIHGHPCEMPERIKKQPTHENVQKPMELEMKCTNWGCDMEY